MKYDILSPMGAARYVRKEKYSFPGGYALALICDDGQCLCPNCVKENFHTISYDTRHKIKGGWFAAGVAIEAGSDSALFCASCDHEIWSEKE